MQTNLNELLFVALFLYTTLWVDKLPGRSTPFPSISRKQHAYGALVITRFRCSLAFSGKLMRFAPSDNLFILKLADSE